MKNSKLIAFLKELSASEMKHFGRFVKVNSLKSLKDTEVFFNHLKKHHPHFPVDKITKERIAKKLFLEDNNRLKKVMNLTHKLMQLLEIFLIQEELECQQKEKDFLLLEALKKRKLDKYFLKRQNKLKIHGMKLHL